MNGTVILLGAPNDDTGKLSSLAVERCREALKVYEHRVGFSILPTGGFGEHFNRTAKPHAYYTRNFLLENGVPTKDILEPALSSFTLEDAALSRPIVDRYGIKDLIVVTSDFHLRRVKLIFERTFKGYTLSFRGSKTNLQQDELSALVAHEEQATARLKLNPTLN